MNLPAAARLFNQGAGETDQVTPRGRAPLRPRRLLIQVAVGLLVGGVLVFFGLRQVSASEIEHTLAQARSWYLVAAAAGAAGFIGARTWRYSVLLFPPKSASPVGRPSRLAVFTVALASWGPGLVLPTPTSDATFIWLGRTRLGVAVDRCATAVVLARLLDFASLLVVGLLTAPLAGVRLPLLGQVGIVAAIFLIAAVLVGLLWAPTRKRLVDLAWRIPFVARYAARVEAGLEELAQTGSLLQLILSTAAARLFTALQYLALFAAVGLGLGFWQAWFALSVRTLLLAIPIQGPAGLGTTQLWWVTALLILGTPRQAAVLGGFSVHVLDLVISLSLAALGWALLLLPARRREPVD
ncbi:MAG: flippase-like domain-containing protein [Candidatus Dormibacteraeota bacterium]|nr:flippase-like domain-containing protein [Candidatus Dormibacteraeota bacterium]